jgi:hypothetical protein
MPWWRSLAQIYQVRTSQKNVPIIECLGNFLAGVHKQKLADQTEDASLRLIHDSDIGDKSLSARPAPAIVVVHDHAGARHRRMPRNIPPEYGISQNSHTKRL